MKHITAKSNPGFPGKSRLYPMKSKKSNGPNLSSPPCLFGPLTNMSTILRPCSSMNSSTDMLGMPSWHPVWTDGNNPAAIRPHCFCVCSSSIADSITNFWSSYLASISYASSSLSPLFSLTPLAVLPVLVSWPQYFLSIVTKNLIWPEQPQLMPISRRFDQSISVCRVQLLHTPSQRLSSCIASSLSYLNGASSSASIFPFPMPPSASVRYSSPWLHFNMPRPAFNYLARPSQFGGSTQWKKRRLWCRVLEETHGPLLPERFVFQDVA